MDIRREQSNTYGKWFLTDVIRAIQNYSLIEPGEEICVALSGGRDSTTLLFILWYLQTYSHLDFRMRALHVKIDDYDTSLLKALCSELGVEYLETRLRADLRGFPRNPCSICAGLRRGAMVEALEGTGIMKVAFGHNADDAAETLLMNIVYSRKLGSFTPRVEIPEGGLVIVRPLVYLDAPLIRRLHAHFRLPVHHFTCPYAEAGARESVRRAMVSLEEQLEIKDFSRSVVAALENVDFTTLWRDVWKA